MATKNACAYCLRDSATPEDTRLVSNPTPGERADIAEQREYEEDTCSFCDFCGLGYAQLLSNYRKPMGNT